jgi:histidine triad (HIT) family protein
MSNDCVFCRIVRGEEFAWRIYEDEAVLAFLDISPVSEGHVLVVPKEHYDGILAIPEEQLVEVARATKLIAERIAAKLGVPEFNVMHASGKSAQQTVAHFHFHVVPRRPNDGMDLWFKPRSFTETKFAALVKKIKI